MPPPLTDSFSKNWWSLSKPDLQEKPSRSTLKSSGISFNSIASAIGLKSKKQLPSLAIQDPPPDLLTSTLPTPSSTTGPTRFSARSETDSTGPLTPVDYQRDECQSLLTLSDPDPFAGRPLIIPPAPQIPLENSPLPVDTHRVSCASSLSCTCDVSTTGSRKLSKKRSMNNLHSSRSVGSIGPSIRYTSLSPSKRPSTVVTGSPTHFTLPKPKLRARGMTDSGGTQKAGFFSEERPASKKLSQKSSTPTLSPPICSTEHTSPRVVIRQPSLSRFFAPPCAPPMHSLPATPHSPSKASSPMQRSNRFAQTSVSSSPISFPSSSSNEILPLSLREKRFSERSVFSQDHDPEIPSSPVKRESKTAPSSPRILKKALSHQSLTGKSSIHPPTLPKPPSDIVDKVFRKQKTSHHIHSPIPPTPDPVDQPSSANSMTFPSLPDFASKAATERASGTGSLGKKRLFSHSSFTRPSTSHCTPALATMEGDSQSILSLRSDRSSYLVPFKPWASPKAAQQSFRDGAGSPVSSSHAEYMPQPILSVAEVAKLEASIENASVRSTRSRALSLLSGSTVASNGEPLDFTPVGLSPPPVSRPRSKQGSMTAKSSAIKAPAFYSPVSPRAWSPPPLPDDESPEDDSRSTITYNPSHSDSPTLLALAPRSRRRSQFVSHPSTERLNPSSTAKRPRSKSTVETNMHRQSIMRKPSFLEIDDDTDQDIDLFSGEDVMESFLDMAKESFEASHSDDP